MLDNRFFGRFTHSLDPKGRLVLPTPFRAPFEAGGWVTSHVDGCLAVMAPDVFASEDEKMQLMAHSESLDERNRARRWYSRSQFFNLDGQGRLPLSTFLRDLVHLTSEALLIGSGDHIEIWEPTDWMRRVEPELVAL